MPISPTGRLLPLLAALAVTTAACGSSSDGPSPSRPAEAVSANASDDARYTEEQAARLAGFRADNDGLAWTGPNECQISVIMTTRGAIDMYASAGDAVVSNPAGDVGVKFHPEPGCRTALLAALRRVK
jgi:hypothetical protein